MKPGKGFARKVPLRATPAEAKTSVPLFKMRKCPVKKAGCGQAFRPLRQGQLACVDCAVAVGGWLKASKAKAAHAEDVKQTRAKLEALKGLKKLRAEAQVAFNAYIRARDKKAGYGCICCGEHLNWDSGKPGGDVDAGHFVSRGNSPELAFDERNVNAQRKGCNRPGGTTRAKFTAGMLARYGAEIVAELDGPTPLTHYRHDDYRAKRTEYRARKRELEKA